MLMFQLVPSTDFDILYYEESPFHSGSAPKDISFHLLAQVASWPILVYLEFCVGQEYIDAKPKDRQVLPTAFSFLFCPPCKSCSCKVSTQLSHTASSWASLKLLNEGDEDGELSFACML